MRKQFVRLFSGFVLVVAVVLVIQVFVFIINGERQRKAWTNSVFQEYLQNFTANLQDQVPFDGYSMVDIEDALLMSADDRVSGLYLRNPDGTVAVAYGKTSAGHELPQPFGDGRIPPPNSEFFGNLEPAKVQVNEKGFTSVALKSDAYTVKIIQSGSLVSVMTTKQTGKKEQTILLPSQVKATDIAGSLTIMFNNKTIALVDVLTYTPFTYKNTERLLKGLLGPFLWSIPLAFMLALIISASISRRSQQYTKGVQDALTLLSKGENGVQLVKTKIDEQRIINEAMEQLDANLLQNKVSRQSWLRSISHDLNTPVASMKLLLDGMADGVFPLNEDTLASVKKENDELSQRIASVVLYANLQSPDTKAELQSLDFADFIDAVLSRLQEGERRRISVDLKIREKQGDPTLLMHAFLSLLDNALKTSSAHILWEIDETGCTITNEGLLSEGVDFFEPWTRGDGGRSTAGNGLGLPIVYQVMRLHQGSASIEQIENTVVVKLRW
ncbi:MAG: HAMP domain-containing sensor histidine kinase [Sphaerochaeta sp.]